ncbi:phage protein [Morganella sp. B601]|uniref:phage protein n=1 Tax=Morganella sp. B601 TaxID=3444315 RepID=UPI003EBDBF98
MKQFGRLINLRIGNEKESIEITNLRIAFSVEKTLTSEPNPAVIRVWNLNGSNRNLITSKIYNRLSLSVAYKGDELRMIYKGDITDVVTLRDGTDFITEMTCGDGHSAYTKAKVNKTLKAGSTDKDIMNEAAKSMGTEKGVVSLPKDRALPRGKVITGNARDVMHKVGRNNNADWSIQDGQVTVLPKDKVVSDNEGFVVSQTTGMINSPEKTDNGLQITMLCNAALRIGGLVRVESIMPEYNGDYKITELEHTGDFMGDDWYTKITCVGGKYQKVENGKSKSA